MNLSNPMKIKIFEEEISNAINNLPHDNMNLNNCF